MVVTWYLYKMTSEVRKLDGEESGRLLSLLCNHVALDRTVLRSYLSGGNRKESYKCCEIQDYLQPPDFKYFSN